MERSARATKLVLCTCLGGIAVWMVWRKRPCGRSDPVPCRLEAYQYTHVEDTRTAEVLTLMGPLVFQLKPYHRLLHATPKECVVVPPNHFVRVRNPVQRTGPESGKGQTGCGFPLVCTDPRQLRRPTSAAIRLGHREIRLAQPPFPLFPGEIVEHAPRPQTRVAGDEALLLLCHQDFIETPPNGGGGDGGGGVQTEARARERKQGDKYYFRGPGLYRPRIEEQELGIRKAIVLTSKQAAYLTAMEALVEEEEEDPTKRTPRYAGECWTVRCVGAYFPPPNARLDRVVDSIDLMDGCALRIRATTDFVDHYTGQQRRAGQEWLVTRDTVGAAYVPSCHESIIDDKVRPVVLRPSQYCVVVNPGGAGEAGEEVTQWGSRALRVGPGRFFLANSQSVLEGGVKNIMTLTRDEALLVEATQSFTEEGTGIARQVASRWLVRGPCSYIPPLTVRVLERRCVIALDENSGVYVRSTATGKVKCVRGAPFMLSADEELWEKPITEYIRRLMQAPRLCIRAQEEPGIIALWASSTRHDAEAMLGSPTLPQEAAAPPPPGGGSNTNRAAQDHPSSAGATRQPTVCDGDGIRLQPSNLQPYRVVSVDVENNALVRLQDTSSGTSRVVAGPATVSLEPYEEFAPITLSGGRPKQPSQIHSLGLFLGPDYMSDSIEVETLDHARLKLELAYNWEFDAADAQSSLTNVFTLPDFIGEACKTLASRVRVALASIPFEDFHRNSASIIRQAIFSSAADGSTEVRGDSLYFLVNGLRITNVDVQSVEPVDPKTRSALTKSVQLAVEILTKSQENQATHHAARIEQEARGALDLQVVKDKATAEEERVPLMEVVVANAAIEQGSASRVQALAESEARLVEAQAELDVTPLRCSAHEAGIDAELDILKRRMEADLAHRRALNELQVERAAKLAETVARKYEAVMAALGEGTVVAIARAGPELKAQMLAALGLQGFLVTDGSAPVNLMNVAKHITQPHQ